MAPDEVAATAETSGVAANGHAANGESPVSPADPEAVEPAPIPSPAATPAGEAVVYGDPTLN
jgi:hypothetical protein